MYAVQRQDSRRVLDSVEPEVMPHLANQPNTGCWFLNFWSWWLPFNRFWVVCFFTLHLKRGLVFLLSSLLSVLLHILRQIFALVSCHVPRPWSSQPSSTGNGKHPLSRPMMVRGRKSTPLIPYPICPFPYHTKTIPQEAFAVQSIEISLDSTSKAVSTLDLMPLTSIQ